MAHDGGRATWTAPAGSSDDEEGDGPQGPLSACRLARRVWHLALLSGMINLFTVLESSILLPFLYSRVRCCGDDSGALPDRYDIASPDKVYQIWSEAREFGLLEEHLSPDTEALLDPRLLEKRMASGRQDPLRACDAPRLPPGSKLWSLSPGCASRAFVQDAAQGLVAVVEPLQKVAGLAVLPVGGALADAVGRKPVLMAYVLCCLVACLLCMADSRMLVGSAVGDLLVYAAGALLCVCWDPKDSTLNGAVSDVVKDGADKSRAFAMMSALNSVGSFGAIATAFFCLRLHLEDYFSPWAGLAILAFFLFMLLLFVVPETYPAELHRPVTMSMLNPVRTQWHALRLVLRDRVLVGLAVVNFLIMFHFIGFTMTTFSFLMLVGFDEEQTVLPGAVGSVSQVACSLLAVGLLPRMGVWHAFIAGNCMFVVTYVFWGPYTILVDSSGPYLANVAQAASFALFAPALQTIVSERVEEDNRGKCFALLSSVSALGAMVGIPFYSVVLFDGAAEGMGRAAPALVSAALAALCTLLSAKLALLAGRVKPGFGPGGVRERAGTDMEVMCPEVVSLRRSLSEELRFVER